MIMKTTRHNEGEKDREVEQKDKKQVDIKINRQPVIVLLQLKNTVTESTQNGEQIVFSHKGDLHLMCQRILVRYDGHSHWRGWRHIVLLLRGSQDDRVGETNTSIYFMANCHHSKTNHDQRAAREGVLENRRISLRMTKRTRECTWGLDMIELVHGLLNTVIILCLVLWFVLCLFFFYHCSTWRLELGLFLCWFFC